MNQHKLGVLLRTDQTVAEKVEEDKIANRELIPIEHGNSTRVDVVFENL